MVVRGKRCVAGCASQKQIKVFEEESTSDREWLKELERENRELKRANEILRKASAYFAQEELAGKSKDDVY